MKHINPMVYQHKFDCKCVAFEHDGTRILIGDSGGRVYRWKIGNTYNVEAMVQAHSTSVEGVVALSDGRVCSVSLDGAIKLWEQSLNDTALQLVKHRS
jgi:WD40 repeat protein